MGVNLYRLKEKNKKSLEAIWWKIQNERYLCVQIYKNNKHLQLKYDQNYYLTNLCPWLDNLYTQADKIVKYETKL